MTNGYSAKEGIKDGFNGFLCKPNDVDDWYKHIIKLIENKKLRRELSRNSLVKVKTEFQWSKSAESHIKIFKKLNASICAFKLYNWFLFHYKIDINWEIYKYFPKTSLYKNKENCPILV